MDVQRPAGRQDPAGRRAGSRGGWGPGRRLAPPCTPDSAPSGWRSGRAPSEWAMAVACEPRRAHLRGPRWSGPAAPKRVGARDRFCGRQFPQDGGGGGDGSGMIQAHYVYCALLLCCPVPKRPWTSPGSWPGGWGPRSSPLHAEAPGLRSCPARYGGKQDDGNQTREEGTPWRGGRLGTWCPVSSQCLLPRWEGCPLE